MKVVGPYLYVMNTSLCGARSELAFLVFTISLEGRLNNTRTAITKTYRSLRHKTAVLIRGERDGAWISVETPNPQKGHKNNTYQYGGDDGPWSGEIYKYNINGSPYKLTTYLLHRNEKE